MALMISFARYVDANLEVGAIKALGA